MSDEALDVSTLLGSDGPIARRLPDFEVRPQQLALSEAVAAFSDSARCSGGDLVGTSCQSK